METAYTTLRGANDAPRLQPANDAAIGIISLSPDCRLRDTNTVSMALLWNPTSLAAVSAIDCLHDRIRDTSARCRERNLKAALGAIVYDLLTAADEPQRPCFRPMNAGSFTAQRIPYRAASEALRLLLTSNLIRRAGGNFDRSIATPTGTVTRLWPTAELLAALADFGLSPANRREHFKRIDGAAQTAKLIYLNAASTWRGAKRVKGKGLPVDTTDPLVMGYAEQVARINAFTAKQTIEGAEYNGFMRVFNCGNQDGHGYRKGGRLWCVGGGYQKLSRKLRPFIRINDEPTVEIDIGSSHLTIFLAGLGLPFDPTVDLYELPGIDREIVKRYVNLCLSQRRIPKRWPDDMRRDFLKEFEVEIDGDLPISCVMESCFAKYPILQERAHLDVDWADLQFIESQAVIDAIDVLNRQFEIAALPVHDSLIVQKSHKERAKEVLSDKFHFHVGVYPRMK